MKMKTRLLALGLLLASLIITGCSGSSEGFAPGGTGPIAVASLSISPSAYAMAVNNMKGFTASGGTPPYSYSIFTGSGSILSTTGAFTAPGVSGFATVRVTDSLGQFADSTVTINAALQISPVSQSLGINVNKTFTATGGVPPLVFSIVSGLGSVNASTGVYTSPSSPSSDTLRVTDAIGNTADATVNTFAALGISPISYELAVNNTTTFSAAGGSAPYTFSIFSGTGTINASGVYTAPVGSGTAIVRVTDSLGGIADANVTIDPALTISPTSQTTLINSSITFTQAGGVSPFTYSLVSGTGSIDANTGIYTAPSSNGSAVIRVTDSIGNFANANVTVTTSLSMAPTAVTIAVNNTATFTGTGGTPPLTYTVLSGTGTMNATTGVYTAAATSGSAVVKVTDSLGASVTSTVTVNAALAISPTSQTTLVNSVISFSASNGVSPYTYSLLSGTGTIDTNTGSYTAPAANGSAIVRVTDSLGNVANANITITSPLSLNPASKTLAVNNTATFTAVGGTSPFTYSILSGTGTVNSASGLYTAPAAAGSAVVKVTDSLGATATSNVTVNAALVLSPASQTMTVNGTLNFSASNGVSPYTFSVFSGGGTINASTGVYTAPAAGGSAVVRVTDSLGNIASSNVTITTGLGISPASTTLAVSNTATFTALGGAGPFTFSILSGGGTINASTGLYTAPATAGTATVKVTDSLAATATATVTINAALAIVPASKTLAVNNVFTFSATGGVSPYTFSVFSGGGTINASTGSYTAPAAAGAVTVRVTDSLGNISNSTVTINGALAISPTSQTVLINSVNTFTGSAGVSPYTYSILSGGGTINSATGAYTAPATNGSATIRVTDSLGNVANSAVTITTTLGITPSPVTLAVNNSQTFSATGGTSPFTFSVFSGGGTINASTGLYTAPAAAGSATVRVTDSLGAVANSTVTINAALQISPATATIASTGTQTFTATGGVSPLTYSIVSGPGTINASTGVYTGSSAGSVIVRVTDSLSNTSSATLTVNGPLAVSPVSAYVIINSDLALTASGGVAPYSYSIVVGGGIIDIATGIYTAPATTGTATLRTTDAAAATVDTAVTIYNALTLSPLSQTLPASGTISFTSSGGIGARTYSMYTGTGTINSTTGVYTASAVAGTDRIHVADTIGNIVEAVITVVSQLTISPPTLKLPVFSTVTFTSVLGSTPYVYSVFAGTGTINSSTGLYTAPSAASVGTVRVTDALTNTSNSAVTHIEPVEIASGSNHSCVRYNEGSVKCFGLGSSGQLGNGSTANLADTASTLGGALPFVNLGTGRTATAIAVGFTHSCALLDNATIKCWGQNTYGELGVGSTTNLGSSSNQMGDSLPAVNLGAGRTATKVFAFGYNTCAILDNGVGKCWGRNANGQLGQNDIVNRGTTATQMGDNLLAINLGAALTPTKFVGGLDFTCALLSNATVKCFGGNRYGQLGQGNTVQAGDTAGSMAALAAINLGTGRTAVDIGGGYSHACAILDNGTAKCWGRNNKGQLAVESTSAAIGTASTDMGNNLLACQFPAAFVPTKMVGGNTLSCFMNAAGAIRCFGLGTNGQLLLGTAPASFGKANGDVSTSANVSMGTGLSVASYGVGFYTVCGIMNNKRIKCWGSSLSGATGGGQTANNLGDVVGELGDSLPYVNH